jgi:signal transduction histidine kinase
MQHQAEILKEANGNLKIKSKLIEGQKRELEAKNKEIMEQRDRLITLNKEIENINQNRMRFYTNITHEFRTPLTLIISPIDRLIREFHFPGQAFDMLNSIQRTSRGNERNHHGTKQLRQRKPFYCYPPLQKGRF